MLEPSPHPELLINYAPTLELCIVFAEARALGNFCPPEYRFELICHVRHAVRTLQYRDPRVFFDLKAIQTFLKQLKGMQQGTMRQASLTDPGDMVVFRIESNPPMLHATLDIREFLPPSSFTLHERQEVDYDLFVNKLCADVEGFLDDIQEMKPTPPEWDSP